MQKATRKQIKRHNQQLVLRALYAELADNRAALAQKTGLTKPTISNIVSELMAQGLVKEGGRGVSTASGGKRPRLLYFVPTARQLIAVTINSEQILGCLAYLDGSVVARHHLEVDEGDDIQQLLQQVINALIAQEDAPLLCVSVGVPGVVDDVTDYITSSALGWHDVSLVAQLHEAYDLPIIVGNNTEFATRVRAIQLDVPDVLVTVLVSDMIEVGMTIDGETYQHGADINRLTTTAGDLKQLEWRNVHQRVQELRQIHPDSRLPAEYLNYPFIRRALLQDDAAALQLLDELSSRLAHLYAWVIALARPTEITLAGHISLLGAPLIEAIYDRLLQLLPAISVNRVHLTLVRDDDLALQGAITTALSQELGIL